MREEDNDSPKGEGSQCLQTVPKYLPQKRVVKASAAFVTGYLSNVVADYGLN